MQSDKAILNRIFKGVIFFLLPVVLMISVLEKAIVVVRGIILPFKELLPVQRIMGIGLLTLISILLILLLCYLAGILSEKKRAKIFVNFLESNLLIFIPGYALMKSRASETIGHSDDEWKAVMVTDNESSKLGIEVEHPTGEYCTIFFPGPPDAKSGEIKLIHESKIKKLEMPVSKLIAIVRKYGVGASTVEIE